MLWRLQDEKQNTKKFCAEHLFADLRWGARTVVASRAVPDGLVTFCTFELAQVKFLLPSSGVCVFTACKTNSSPLE